MADEPKNKIVVKLEKVFSQDKEGKPVMENGEPLYKQEDVSGLFHLLNRYDSTKHPGTMKGHRNMIIIKDKVETAMIEKKDELVLTLEEAHWLKDYLDKITTNEAAQVKLQQFEIRTLTSVLDQLQ